MTDTRSNTKANSIVTLNRHRRGSSPTNETINDRCFDDIEEDSDVLPRTPVRPIIMKKSMTTGRIARKNSINKSTPVIERSIQRSNQNQRIKASTVGKKKPQKYNWSGTFRKTSPKNIHSHIKYYLPREELYDMNSQLMNYNYYCEDFAKKSANKRDNFYSNQFESQAIDNSWKEWTDDSIGCHPCIDICTDNFEGYNNFKDYDIDQDNGASPAAFSDININLRQRKTMDVGDKNKGICDVDPQMNSSIILYSQREHDIDNVNKENDNLFNVKEFVDPSINIKSNIRKITGKKSAIQLNCYEICCSLLSFVKNVIFFSLLPIAYIIFFIYVQEREDKKTG